VGYNAIEAVVAITSGVAAGSVALVSFGGDSIVECLSALVILWQFRGLPEQREQAAMKGIAVAFFVLAAYITIDSARSLLTGADPESSPVGIALAATSLVVMPLLVVAKRRTARALGSATVMGRQCADTLVHLPVGSAAGRFGRQRALRVGVGRPAGGADHRLCRGARRRRSMAGGRRLPLTFDALARG
jgi:hypothetical protein